MSRRATDEEVAKATGLSIEYLNTLRRAIADQKSPYSYITVLNGHLNSILNALAEQVARARGESTP